ncbi:MAG: 50S ribosomal protein L29 [Patescibacteria group bacterium]|jgi:ribosomal protein L29
MNLEELRTKTENEIEKELVKVRSDVEKFAREIIKGKEKNITKLRNMKKDYARIATVLNEKRILARKEKNE